MLARIAWALALTAQILCCACGLGGFINSILSWEGWLVLGRLTYSVYLLHLGLLSLLAVGLRNPFMFSPDFNFVSSNFSMGVCGHYYTSHVQICNPNDEY